MPAIFPDTPHARELSAHPQEAFSTPESIGALKTGVYDCFSFIDNISFPHLRISSAREHIKPGTKKHPIPRAKMLCAVCFLMFQRNDARGDHHRSVEDLTKAAENGCRICESQVERLQRQKPPFTYEFLWEQSWRMHWRIFFQGADTQPNGNTGVYIHVAYDKSVPPGYDEFTQTVRKDLEDSPYLVRKDFPAPRDIPDNTGHEAVAEKAKQWLLDCKANHSCETTYKTRQANWYPKRLIDVGSLDQPPRLVLREEDDLKGNYATLSHCWGENPEFLMLTSTNLEDFRQRIPLEELPSSFHDAVVTCQRIGIPYLWVDSLCILQLGESSDEDWLWHSSEMHRVYQNCELNIAINHAGNPDEGAFRSRDPVYLQDCYVWSEFREPPAGERDHVLRFQAHITGQRLADIGFYDEKEGKPSSPEDDSQGPKKPWLLSIFTDKDFSMTRKVLPLSKRAWVLQEKLLSPRALHFQEDRIAWECAERQTLSEYLPDSIASQGIGFDCLWQTSFNIGSRGVNTIRYYDFVLEYMERQLSHPDEDKLVAFAAIATHFAEHFKSDYCAGVFRSSLPFALLWEVRFWSFPQPKRADTYRAPSWSWASMDGRVDAGAITTGDVTDLVTVEDVVIDLVDPNNPYGQIKSGSLTLTASLIPWEALLGSREEGEESASEHESDLGFPSSIHTAHRELGRLRSTLGEIFEFNPDDIAPNYYKEEDIVLKFLAPLKDTFVMPVADVNCPPELDSFRGCYGLVLHRLSDGTYTRMGHWKGKLGFRERHIEAGYKFSRKKVVIV